MGGVEIEANQLDAHYVTLNIVIGGRSTDTGLLPSGTLGITNYPFIAFYIGSTSELEWIKYF